MTRARLSTTARDYGRADELRQARAEGAAAERVKLMRALEAFKTVLEQPGNGYLVDAIAWANLLSVIAAAENGWLDPPSAAAAIVDQP